MPLARIDLAEGKTTDYRRTIGEVVYNALVEVLKAPKDDRFQVIAERPVQDFIFAPSAGVSARAGKTCSFVWSKSAKRTGRSATARHNTRNRWERRA
jgi:phenylpyruvate tautomerase PptA (4-oxalocrotonate tautomerase family)